MLLCCLFVQGLVVGGVVVGLVVIGFSLCVFVVVGFVFVVVLQVFSGQVFQLSIGELFVNFIGCICLVIIVNGSLLVFILCWCEGDIVMVCVVNVLQGYFMFIYWYGILLLVNMDGVLGLSFNGIVLGEVYQYWFIFKQFGMYWYYSYLMFQEQVGLYGVLIIDLLQLVLYCYDCEYVIMFLDWIDMDLGVLFWCMKKFVEYDNYYKCILFDFLCDVCCDGWVVVIVDCGMWGWMWMIFIDIFDINVYIYIYLFNGIMLVGNWIGLFCSGEKVLLCFINGGLMIYFDVCIFGLKMIVVVVDG